MAVRFIERYCANPDGSPLNLSLPLLARTLSCQLACDYPIGKNAWLLIPGFNGPFDDFLGESASRIECAQLRVGGHGSSLLVHVIALAAPINAESNLSVPTFC
jgi:hypothetical protein